MNLILTGPPGCGKSTIGKAFAQQSGHLFIDTDQLIEKKHAPHTCREIMQQHGESYFRTLETEAILSLNSDSPSIIAIGGGALLSEVNAKHLKSIGKVIYLRGDLQMFFQQVMKNGKPSYLDPKNPEQSYLSLAKQRIPIYEKTADYCIDISQYSIDEILNQLCEIRMCHG